MLDAGYRHVASVDCDCVVQTVGNIRGDESETKDRPGCRRRAQLASPAQPNPTGNQTAGLIGAGIASIGLTRTRCQEGVDMSTFFKLYAMLPGEISPAKVARAIKSRIADS
ncbi:hypothetical protein J3459_003884 [Metarhizium acridum]|uniref:uncharacterized protein n=1 Tax=Metarhizium acridum TaxID=92637 RepID=UPI001C6ACF75|nr:hypothetical protein J3458_002833 [Metarhizium acridum]KAG8428461.1 hypothetical protein J3459_003884 [Metarhizium acridum]